MLPGDHAAELKAKRDPTPEGSPRLRSGRRGCSRRQRRCAPAAQQRHGIWKSAHGKGEDVRCFRSPWSPRSEPG